MSSPTGRDATGVRGPSACPWPPVEPPATPWDLGGATLTPGVDLVALGADLAPGTLLAAYRCGLFPMPADDRDDLLAWWSPDPRGVLLPGELRVTRSLRQSAKHYTVTVDVAFAEVVEACADPSRSGAWITEEIAAAYGELHRLGWAHSVEVWAGEELAGGLYGVAVGDLFAGESMFHRRRDASKVALAALVGLWQPPGQGRLIDVQWCTDHLASLGVREVARADYLAAASSLAARPGLPWPSGAVEIAWPARRSAR